MKLTVESTLSADAEWRRVGPRAEAGVVFAKLDGALEARVRMDDPMRGEVIARAMRKGMRVQLTAGRAWPRTDHAEAAVLLGDITAVTVDGRELL